jgi:hypothetical protein
MSQTRRLIAPAAIGIWAAASSCHPIGPPDEMAGRPATSQAPAPNPADTPAGTVLPTPSETTTTPAGPQAPTGTTTPAAGAASPAPSTKPGTPSAPPKPTPPPADDIPTAQKAPGRPGYVLSPYTGKLMLVRGVPSGVVVPDQTSPDSGKKFRVP